MSDYPEYVPISIHAPAKGATVSYLESDTYHNISIHAPAKGATFLWICKRYICWYFNPRSREGSDRLAYAVTHTPNYFNPRSREGSDNVQSLNVSLLSRFQSTLPRRERLRDTEMAEPVTQFQSTLPRRERQIMGRMD